MMRTLISCLQMHANHHGQGRFAAVEIWIWVPGHVVLLTCFARDSRPAVHDVGGRTLSACRAYCATQD